MIPLREPDHPLRPDIHPEQVQLLGHYAVAIHWSDGHSSGIFSWDYLKYLAGELGDS